ncbi:MAG: hypothetical protein K2Q18_14925 [Bdellovibrionales bacterium]|nr:hypothetical protein [Bdellovibrionales bacterium]
MQLSVVSKIAMSMLLSLGVGLNAYAGEKVLCLVTSDLDKEVGKMVYEYDDETRVVTHLYKERHLNDKLIERVEVNIDDLLGDGLILHKKDNYITVRLYSHNFDISSGGVLYLDTLYNGVKNERKEYLMEVRMDGGEDAVMTYNKVAFTRMHFVPKKVPILGIVGIEKVNFLKK